MNRVWVRTAIVGAVVAALIAGAVYLRSRPQGLPIADIPPVDSKGIIAALMEKEGSTRVVAILPDGTIRESAGDADVVDSEIVWKPDGKRVLFVSNRSTGGSLQVFEWRPDRDGDPIQLTPGGASRQNPWFLPDSSRFIYASAGNILGTTYPMLRSQRIMPPSVGRDGLETESGEHVHVEGEEHEHDMVSTVWTSYSQAIEGEAFTKGFVDGDILLGQYTTARGQTVILQNLNPADQREAMPQAPFGGSALDIAYHAQSGRALVAIIDFRYPNLAEVPPEAIMPDGTVQPPFRNGLFAISLRDKSAIPVFLSADDAQTLMSPAISPDGTQVAFVIMETVDGAKRVTGMLVAPIEEGGVQRARPVALGQIASPAWSADGNTLAFVRDGDVWTIGVDGQNEKNLTNGAGRFSTPLFSPMR